MTRTGKRIDAVIFDLDDTLIDWSGQGVAWEEFTRPRVNQVYDYVAEAGLNLPGRDAFIAEVDEQIQAVWDEAKEDFSGAYFGDALLRTLDAFDVPHEQLDVDELMRVYNWQPMPGVTPYEDTHDVLATLHRRGYKLGLITNSFFPMWMRDVELEHYDLIGYFDARITSGDTGFMKPHPAIYHRILDLLDTTPERAVFIGDRPRNDIAGANETGLVSVLIDPPHLERELNGVVPDYTITKLSELLPILEALEEREDHGEKEDW